MDERFNKNIDKLKELYLKDSNDTDKKLNEFINNIDNKTNLGVFGDVDKNILYNVILIIIILLLGLITFRYSSEDIPIVGLYYFGFVFFIAGILISNTTPIFGLIFLLSHGGTGFALMTIPTIISILNEPYMSDNPKLIYMYLGIIIIILIIASIITVLNNLSSNLRKNKNVFSLALTLFAIDLLLIILLPIIANYLV